jgi:hypothetical protein
MSQGPVFEIRGRSIISLVLHVLVDIILFAAILILFPYLFYSSVPWPFVLFALILAVSVTIFMAHLTRKVMMIKIIIIDGKFFYLYYEDRLKRKIALKDIIKVTRSKISWPQAPLMIMFYKFIRISYREGRKFKSLYITEDDFPKQDLAIIFEEFKRYARERKRPIIEPHYIGEPYF